MSAPIMVRARNLAEARAQLPEKPNPFHQDPPPRWHISCVWSFSGTPLLDWKFR